MEESSTARDDSVQTQNDRSTLVAVVNTSGLERHPTANISVRSVDIGVVSSDIWSTAYREAVDSLGKDIDVAILKGENIAQLFRQLEEIDKEAAEETLFLRGVKYLKSLQVPLEKFKLALDVAAPLASIEPTATIVFGVVRSVTAVSSFLRNLTPPTLCESDYIRNPDSHIHRSLSALQLQISSSRSKSEKCWSKSPISMTVTHSARKRTR